MSRFHMDSDVKIMFVHRFLRRAVPVPTFASREWETLMQSHLGRLQKKSIVAKIL